MPDYRPQLPGYPGAPGQAGALAYANPEKDAADLKTLSICWYVWAAITLLPAVIFVIWIGLGALFTLGGLSSRDAAPVAALGGLFLCFGVCLIALVLTIAYCNYRCGKNLAERRGITLCYVMAVIACINIPLGLVLGIFTFVVLNRPSVKATFR
jgi:hypothetical protein